MKRALLILAVAALACSQTKQQPIGEYPCAGGGLLDPGKNWKAFVCFDKDKKHPRIVNGYSVEQALALMMDRENNAWDQLVNISDQSRLLVDDMMRAREGRDEYGKSPRARDIRSVMITKTTDKGNFVIMLRTGDGVIASLWLNGGDIQKELTVRSVTPY